MGLVLTLMLVYVSFRAGIISNELANSGCQQKLIGILHHRIDQALTKDDQEELDKIRDLLKATGRSGSYSCSDAVNLLMR